MNQMLALAIFMSNLHTHGTPSYFKHVVGVKKIIIVIEKHLSSMSTN